MRSNHPSILSRWQKGEIYRASQGAIGWTGAYVKYLDFLTTVDIMQEAPYRKRYRYENMIFMRRDHPNPQAGPLWKREDFKTSASALMCLQQEQGKCVPHIPIQVRTRQHNTLDPTIQENLYQKNGKTKSGGRNGKRRQQTIDVHTSIGKLTADEYCFNSCPSCPEFVFFFAV